MPLTGRTLCGVGSLLLGAAALASPGDLPVRSPSSPGEDQLLPERQEVTGEDVLKVLDSGRPCAQKNGVCFFPASRSTLAVESQEVASVVGAGRPMVGVVPRFARSVPAKRGQPAEETGPWSLELSASLRKPALKGNAIFLFFDLEDRHAVEERTTTALYQTQIKAGRSLSANIELLPREGFRAGHTYRLRIVQLVGGKEILLTESDFALL
jgi:hypothetical protein